VNCRAGGVVVVTEAEKAAVAGQREAVLASLLLVPKVKKGP
jgi:hypothetical protein